MPYLEQKPLYDKIDLSKPWDDPSNGVAHQTDIHDYQCPSGKLSKCQTTYCVVTSRGSCFPGAESRKLTEIADGPDRTLLVVEVPVENAVHWMSPRDVTEDSFLSAIAADKPPHPSGSQAARADASIVFLQADTPPAKLRALLSIAGNDDADLAD